MLIQQFANYTILELQTMLYEGCSQQTARFIADLCDDQTHGLRPDFFDCNWSSDLLAVLRAGKKIRPAMISLFGRILGIEKRKLISVAQSLEIYHTATLLLDDIQDESERRRGMPCFHTKHGVPLGVAGAALLRANMYHPIDSSCEFTPAERAALFSCINETVIDLCVGQYHELSWRASGDFSVSESEYFAMVGRKTGSLFYLAAQLPFQLPEHSSTTETQTRKLAELLGTLFQIRDDLLSLDHEAAELGKDCYADIQESKQTLMVLHALNHSSFSEELRDILSLSKKNENQCTRYLEIITAAGSIQYAYDMLASHSCKVKESLQDVCRDIEVIDCDAFNELVCLFNFFTSRRR